MVGYDELFTLLFSGGEIFYRMEEAEVGGLVLLRKVEESLDYASSYRPICLLDTMGKLLEEMIYIEYRVTWLARTVSRTTSSCFRKAGP